MKGNRAANKKIFCIILFVFVLPVFGQTEKPLSEFEKHRQKAAEFAEKQDWKNCLFELEILLKIASTKEEKINANNWLGGYYLYYIEPKNFLKAIPFFEEVIKLDDKDLSAIEGLGIIYANDKIIEVKIKKALPFLLHAEKFSSKNSVIYYNISCIYSLLKEIDKAIQYLDKAIYNGDDNIEWIKKDSDLENIRKTEYYTRLVSNWEKVKQGNIALLEGRKAYGETNYNLALQSFLKADELFTTALGKDNLQVALSSIWAGNVYDSKGEYDKAIEYYTKSLAIRLKILGEEHPSVAISYNNLGYAYKSKGEYDKASEYYAKSLAIYRKTFGEEHPDVATSYNNLGAVYESKGEYDKAIEYFAKSLAIYIKTFGREHLDVATSYNNLGAVYESKGEYDKAIEYYTKSLAIQLKTLGENHPDVTTPYNNLGVAYRAKGEYDKAIEYYTKSLAIRLKILGEEHPSVAISYNNLGYAYKSKGEYDKASEYYAKSLAIYRKTFGEEHPDVATSYNNLGAVYESKGEYDKAIEYFAKSLAIYIKTFGREHLDVAGSYNNLGEAYTAKGEYDKAIEYYTKSLAIRLKTLGENHPDVATSYNNLGVTYDYKGEYDKAIEYYTKDLVISLKTFGGEHPGVAGSYNNLGVAYRAKGEYDKAIEYHREAITILEKSGDRFGHVNSYLHLRNVYQKQNNEDKRIYSLKMATDIILKYRTQMGKDKEYFTQKFIPIFEELIQIYNDRGEYEKAFEISEKMRGLSMMEEINLKYALKSISPPKDSKEYNVFQINTNRFLSLRGQMQGLDSQRVAALNRGDAGKVQLETISKKIMETQNEMDGIEKEFSKKPEYTKLRKFIPPSIKEIQTKLMDTNQVFLEYDLIQKEGKEELHVFVISPDGFKHEKWDATRLTDKVKQLRAIISLEPSKRRFARLKDSEKKEKWCNSDACAKLEEKEEYKETILDIENSFKNDAKLKYIQKVYHRDGTVEKEEANAKMEELLHEVYDLTIKNLVAKKHLKPNSKLVISPDSVLFTIPFSALKNEKGKYLVEDYKISLIHSVSIWERLIRNGEVNHTKPFFAMGNSVYSAVHSDSIKNKTGSDLAMYSKFKDSTRSISNTKELDESDFGDLNETLGEIQTISNLVYKAKDVPEHIYLGIRANKEELYKKFEHPKEIYRSVLFAVHGILNMESPELNSLLLTSRERALRHKTEKDQFKKYEEANGKLTRDGTFKLGETIELGIKTDLLVMSACETSLGTEKAGEGMVGLPQGFLMGGANNVLATLWSVSSTGTMFFISDFYESYFKNKKNLPANSLQIIQKKFATEKDFKYADPFYWSPFVVYGK